MPERVSDVELKEPGMADATEDSGWNLICSSCIALHNTASANSQLASQHATRSYSSSSEALSHIFVDHVLVRVKQTDL